MTRSRPMRAIHILMAAILWSATLVAGVAEARICTSIGPIFGVGDLNCSSAVVCEDLAVGTSCGKGLECKAFATRFNSACCTCESSGLAATRRANKCDAKQSIAEAKFVACHTSQSARLALRGKDPDYAKCFEKFDTQMARIAKRLGPDCPDRPHVQEAAQTLAGLLGDRAINPQPFLVCGPNTQWDLSQQLCVPLGPP